jgi:tetratricopeptide (TPR) repeat protein
MFRNDYILRMIDEMTQMIAKVFDLKKERKFTEALWEIDEVLSKQFGLNSRFLNSLPIEEITDICTFGNTVESDKLQSIAYLLYEEGKIYSEQGQIDEGLTRLMKALHLFLVADLHNANEELIHLPLQIQSLQKATKDYRLPLKTELLLFQYQEKKGYYAEAENGLFRLLEQDGMDIEEGLSFYERLKGEDDERLVQGRLPRTELVDGIMEIKQRIQSKPFG